MTDKKMKNKIPIRYDLRNQGIHYLQAYNNSIDQMIKKNP